MNTPRLTRILFCLGLGLTAAARAEQPIKVFILAGQSNMEGQGVVSMDHEQYYNGGKGNLVWSMEHSASKERMRHLRDADGKWVVREVFPIIGWIWESRASRQKRIPSNW